MRGMRAVIGAVVASGLMWPGSLWAHMSGASVGGAGWTDELVFLLSPLLVLLVVGWLMLDARREGQPPRKAPRGRAPR